MPSSYTLPPGEARGLKGGGGEAGLAESLLPKGKLAPLAVKHVGVLSPGCAGRGGMWFL